MTKAIPVRSTTCSSKLFSAMAGASPAIYHANRFAGESAASQRSESGWGVDGGGLLGQRLHREADPFVTCPKRNALRREHSLPPARGGFARMIATDEGGSRATSARYEEAETMVNLIQQPAPFDLVGNPILVGGIGQGFEATLQYRVHDGHDERTGFFNVGGGTGEHGQYQIAVDVAGAAFQLDRLFVEVYEESARNGSEINKITVPVIFGPRIVPGYVGYRIHVVQPGDTLSAIADANYGSSAAFQNIVRANPLVISNPDLIFPGQALKIPIGA
ncbi:Gmad2 immunoglobulin-like domain-containing protein [Bauldia litoralis]|nr:Gmad2 immunoglobulin-like domain-containing protein [Bauldia litoralis]